MAFGTRTANAFGGIREQPGDSTSPQSGIRLFAMDRQGRVLWSTAEARRDLAELGTLTGGEGAETPCISPAWTRRLWAQIREHSDERQTLLLMPGLLPHTGLLMWNPVRRDRLTLMLWARGDTSCLVDPTWQKILGEMTGFGTPPSGSRAA